MESSNTSKIVHRAVEVANERGEFVTDVDGFVYWWPTGTSCGHHNSAGLRALADELDRRNAQWQAEIDREFGPEPDARCITTPDGGCISDDCMHTEHTPAEGCAT